MGNHNRAGLSAVEYSKRQQRIKEYEDEHKEEEEIVKNGNKLLNPSGDIYEIISKDGFVLWSGDLNDLSEEDKEILGFFE